jgi:hypothetical protein
LQIQIDENQAPTRKRVFQQYPPKADVDLHLPRETSPISKRPTRSAATSANLGSPQCDVQGQ